MIKQKTKQEILIELKSYFRKDKHNIYYSLYQLILDEKVIDKYSIAEVGFIDLQIVENYREVWEVYQ